ncbi:MAG: mucoidy inhibitor MuiA family protein [Chitinophagaceae bacterium]|nr:mucoidy inhibitor MuiA family protein [Chitinophagaceae bacterium]
MKKFFLWAVIIMAGTTLFAQDTIKADASLAKATVYFGYGAELTHESKIKIDQSTKIIVLDQLSTSIDINSLQVSCPEDVTLLSQRFRLYTQPAPPIIKNKEVDVLQDSIEIYQQEINRLNNLIRIEDETREKTGQLIETTINKSEKKEITSMELLKLIDFYTAKIERSKTNTYNYGVTQQKLNKKIQELREKITKLNKVEPVNLKSWGQVILQVVSRKSQEIPVSLSYYTPNAGWVALYDIRVNSKTNKVKLVYKATVTQTTGFNWKQTKLTLSTGTPNFGISAPVLTPWYLQLYVPGLYTDLERRAQLANAGRNTIQSYRDEEKLSQEVVVTGYGAYKVADKSLTVDPSTLQNFTKLNEGQLNTNFEIDLPYDIESDGLVHSVNIRDQEINCVLKNYAVPRMDKDAYLLAEVADWQNLDLLPGDANIIMDDTYIGKSIIDPNSTADTLNLSLGRDQRIAIRRTTVKELTSLKTNGPTSKQVFTWEVTVKNNKLTDVNLLLKDQYPLSNIKEVEVKMEDDGGAMVNPDTGVLTWKVDLKPGESRKLRFSYSVKYPKDKKIVNLR